MTDGTIILTKVSVERSPCSDAKELLALIYSLRTRGGRGLEIAKSIEVGPGDPKESEDFSFRVMLGFPLESLSCVSCWLRALRR